MAAQQLSNGRNVSGSWAVTETLNAWYEPKDHSIAVCYEYIEERLQTHEGPSRQMPNDPSQRRGS